MESKVEAGTQAGNVPGVTVPCLRGANLPAPRPLPELAWAVCLRPNGRGQRPQSLQTKAGKAPSVGLPDVTLQYVSIILSDAGDAHS